MRFKKLPSGTKFISERGKRRFGGVKISPTPIKDKEGNILLANAVIITDHNEQLAKDAGSLIFIDDQVIIIPSF